MLKKIVNINNKKKGFTLIELLVVITIIGLLSTLAIFSLNSARAKARDAKRMSDLKTISEAVEMYHIDNNGYPIGTVFVTHSESDCGTPGILDYSDSVGTQLFCSNYPFQDEDDVYIESLPEPPGDYIYYYDDLGLYNYSSGSLCLYVWLDEMKDGYQVRFFCRSGNCAKEYYPYIEYSKVCYGE